MLDAFIIDQIKKREDAERQRRGQIQPSIPLPLPPIGSDADQEKSSIVYDVNHDYRDDTEVGTDDGCVIDMKPSPRHQLYHL